MNQSEKATAFKALHVAGTPLVLYNIWDAGGAQALTEAGAKAVATGSLSVAAAHGYDDGEAIPLDFLLSIVERIAVTTDLPLSVDFEGGYAIDPQAVASNVRRVITAGAIGINFEDQVIGRQGLHAVADQVVRIKAVRRAADAEGVPLFINARTDLFLQAKPAQHADLLEAALERASAYAEAGADGFFVPGLTQHDLIGRICRDARLPVNAFMMGDLQSIERIADLGAARASFGPAAYRMAMADLVSRFRTLR